MTEASAGNLDFLHAEPAQGELLADKLAHGALPPEDALRYAVQIGAILSRAHARGLVHGSLSPYTVTIGAAGACVLKPPSSPDARAAAHRSPEQIRGESPDWRSDIFAFGALLRDLAIGSSIVSHEAIVNAMERVSAACLAQNPSQRRQRMQNAVIELKLEQRIAGIASRKAKSTTRVAIPEPAAALELVPKRAVRQGFFSPVYRIRVTGLHRQFWIISAAMLLLAASGVAAALYLYRPAIPVYRFHVDPPEHANYPGTPAISPDGNYVALSAVGPEGQRMLWVRALAEAHPQLIAGTEGAFAPFWSPDSQFVGFFANHALRKVKLGGAGGDNSTAPQTICEAGTMPGGGTWNRNGVILFAPDVTGALFRVPATGGIAQPVLKLDGAKSERGQVWPQFLPDGKHFLFFMLTDQWETSGVYAGALDSPQSQRLLRSETNAVYSPVAGSASRRNGYLLFIKDRNLMAQAFNASTLQLDEDPMIVAADVGAVESLSLAQVSVSDSAILIYQSAGKATRELVWKDRTGKRLGTAGDTGAWGPPRISPDGKRVAAGKLGEDRENADLWILNLGGAAIRITGEPAGGAKANYRSPTWSPDGSRIAYAANREGEFNIYSQIAGQGAKAELLCKTAYEKHPTDWSRDGKFIVFETVNPGLREGVWALALADRRFGSLIDTVRSERFGSVSPDGKWLAYQSDETGAYEVYVQPFDKLSPGTERLWRVSTDGGGLPRWRGDGAELFYMTSDGRMMAVPVQTRGGEFSGGQPHLLFQSRPTPKTWNSFDVAPDGQRFILNLPMEWPNTSPIAVTTSWTRKL